MFQLLAMVVPAGAAALSGSVSVMPEPAPRTPVFMACAAVSAGANVMPVPGLLWSRTAALLLWASASAGVTFTPVPVAPGVPTAVMVTVSALEPLSPAAVGTLAAGTGWDATALHALTGGNPFLVTEVLAAAGPLQHSGGVPATVAAMLVLRTVFCGATIPLLWLAVAGIVYGVSMPGWLDAARRVAGSRADRVFERAAAGSKRFSNRGWRVPHTFSGRVRAWFIGKLGNYGTIVDSARLVLHGGFLALVLYIFGYLALAWLDMAGAFYRPEVSIGYLVRFIAWLFGLPVPTKTRIGASLVSCA